MKRKKIEPKVDELILDLITLWRKFLKIPGPNDRLQTREFRSVVEEIKSLRDSTKFKTRQSLAAYCLYYFPLHYLEGLSLISELANTPKRVLDLYSGPGPFSLAAMVCGSEEVIGLDENKDSLNLASEILGRQGFTFTQRVWKDSDPIADMGKFDLIILGYAPTVPENLFDHLADDGCVMFVDSSWPKANQRILSLRDDLVEKGYHVVAPCIYKGKCPALIKNFPCFAQRELKKPFLISEIQRSADINLSSLKMSYLIVSKQPQIQTDAPLYRVVSPFLNTRFGKKYSLCGVDGYKSLGSRVQEFEKNNRAFEFLNRGDVVLVEDGLKNDQSLDIVEDTKIQVEACVSKPIPYTYRFKPESK
jgi:SAM-dependent methyltransferase